MHSPRAPCNYRAGLYFTRAQPCRTNKLDSCTVNAEAENLHSVLIHLAAAMLTRWYMYICTRHIGVRVWMLKKSRDSDNQSTELCFGNTESHIVKKVLVIVRTLFEREYAASERVFSVIARLCLH